MLVLWWSRGGRTTPLFWFQTYYKHREPHDGVVKALRKISDCKTAYTCAGAQAQHTDVDVAESNYVVAKPRLHIQWVRWLAPIYGVLTKCRMLSGWISQLLSALTPRQCAAPLPPIHRTGDERLLNAIERNEQKVSAALHEMTIGGERWGRLVASPVALSLSRTLPSSQFHMDSSSRNQIVWKQSHKHWSTHSVLVLILGRLPCLPLAVCMYQTQHTRSLTYLSAIDSVRVRFVRASRRLPSSLSKHRKRRANEINKTKQNARCRPREIHTKPIAPVPSGSQFNVEVR